MGILIGLAVASVLAIGWFKGNVFATVFLSLGCVVCSVIVPVFWVLLPFILAPYFIRKRLIGHQPIAQGGGIRVQYLHPSCRLLP